MAVCARCGTQNPDANRFCQNCGQPLALAAPPPAPPAPSPPPPAGYQPAYQTPYYAPQPGQAVAVSRTSPWLLIGILGGLVLFILVAAVIMSAILLRPSPTPHPVANTTSAPVSTPAPFTQPSSTPVPTPTPTRSGGGSNMIKTNSFQVNAPGWKTLHQDNLSVTLLSPQQDGTLQILGGQLKQQSDTKTFLDQYLADLAKKYPDAKLCLQPKSESHGGKDGIIVGACYSYTPQTGAAFPAADVIWASVDSNNNLYTYDVFCQVKDFDTVYNKEVLPVIADDSLQWAS
ncbi:MAG TPA: zinc ribbon domain-containing protein [Candidatus Dormibacteraeota bacterium]